jgi:ClpP class serine protease
MKYCPVNEFTLRLSTDGAKRININRISRKINKDTYVNEIEMIHKLKKSKFKAIFIQVNTLICDLSVCQLMWKAIASLAKDKIVVASFSDRAASAGYNIAMGVNVIIAERLLLIGVVLRCN